jgi:Xaa-Pro aminopeptidase
VNVLNRTKALKQGFEQKGFDGFLIANNLNIFYLSGVEGASCLLIPGKGENTIYVYGVNYQQAKADGKGFDVELVGRDENLMAKIAKRAKTLGLKKLAVDALNSETYRGLAKEMRGNTRIKVQGNLVWELRKVKDEDEVKLMRKAGELTVKGMKAAHEALKPGLAEIQVAAEIEYAMRRKGSWGIAFETSVASGVRSAFPHGGCTDRKIRAGDLVVIDIGAKYRHYCSDMTRTFVAGKPSEKQMKLYRVVHEAQSKAHEAITVGASGRDVDAVARSVIEKAGYGEFFVHGLGHGIGLEVHEPPSLSPISKDKLAAGNVVTNEPGIYLVGFGGIRIEDSVLVGKRAAEKLTQGLYTLETERK